MGEGDDDELLGLSLRFGLSQRSKKSPASAPASVSAHALHSTSLAPPPSLDLNLLPAGHARSVPSQNLQAHRHTITCNLLLQHAGQYVALKFPPPPFSHHLASSATCLCNCTEPHSSPSISKTNASSHFVCEMTLS